MMTEGGASKKTKETKHSGEYKPPKKRKNKTKEKPKKKKKAKPKSTQSLKPFFSCIHFLQRYELITTNKQTNNTHPKCNAIFQHEPQTLN
jgi:hypothetical protein